MADGEEPLGLTVAGTKGMIQMKRLMTMVTAGALALVTAGSAGAAPMPTDPLGNHPAFPMVCEGGQFDYPTPGWVVLANDGSDATLPTAFFYPGLDVNGPDLSADAVLGVSMYRETLDVTDGVMIGEGGRGNLTKDDVLTRWDIATCTTPPMPGESLASVYPDGAFQAGHDYVFVNYVK